MKAKFLVSDLCFLHHANERRTIVACFWCILQQSGFVVVQSHRHLAVGNKERLRIDIPNYAT